MAGRKGAGGRKGRSGRRPLPREVKEARGTLEPAREARALAHQPPVVFPPARKVAPDWLDEEGRNEWNRLYPLLDGVRVVTEGDHMALATLCDATARMINAARILKAEGLTVKFGDGVREHPMVKTSKEAAGLVLRFAIEFGLTPAARTRVAAGAPATPTAPAEKPVDEAETFLFQRPTLVVNAGGKP